MRRRAYLLLAVLPFLVALAPSALAAPTLVDVKFKDPVGAIDTAAPSGDDVLSAPVKGGKGSSKEKGSSGNSANSNLKALTLWLSSDGRTWTAVSNDVLNLSSDGLTARLGTNGSDKTSDPLSVFALPATDLTGDASQSYYVGLSTSSTSFDSGSFSARLVSWQYLNARQVTSSLPEPSVWPLFAAGTGALALFFGRRRKR